MQISIRIIYRSDSRLMQKASFPVNIKLFKEDPAKEAARLAYEWWKQIKKKMSYRAEIESVVYNEEIDITELVRQMENQIPGGNLPF